MPGIVNLHGHLGNVRVEHLEMELMVQADLLVLRANPLDDIRNTRTLEAVYIAGQRVAR